VRLYRFADHTLTSEVQFDELPITDSPLADSIHIAGATEPPTTFGRRRAASSFVRDTHTDLLTIETNQSGFLLRFDGLADIAVNHDGTRICVCDQPLCAPDTLRHLILDHVLPRVLGHRGRLVLHAGAVEIGNAGLIVAGGTGTGKSTLVASLHMRGFNALTDDGVLVAKDSIGFTVLSLYRGLRLWPKSTAGVGIETAATLPVSSTSSKRRLDLGSAPPAASRPLDAVFVLDAPTGGSETDSVVVTPLSRREACIEVMRSAFALDLESGERAAALLAAAADLAAEVPIMKLSYPRSFAVLPAVHTAIVREIQRLQARASVANATEEKR